MPHDLLKQLLDDNELLDAAEKVGDNTYQLRWGSATLLTGTSGNSIVVIAPMFEQLPDRRQEDFMRHLLELNATMGGTAAFAIQQDGSVVLQVGRGTDGLDPEEFAVMLGTVGRFADEHDDKLHTEFYA